MRRPLALLLLAALVAVSPSAAADDPFSGSPPPDAKDESTADYLKALEMQRKGHWKEAQKAFRDVAAKYPSSVHKDDCEMRGGDNCYMGCETMHETGPPSKRIDVTVMGDGFTNDPKQQATEAEWARHYVDNALWSEAAYSEYRNYFNFYFVRLVSKDEGVDEVLTPEQEKALEEKNKHKSKKEQKKPREFNTAIDCKAAGPQRQVVADRDLVYQWLDYASKDVPGCGNDGLVIAFAKFGQLGMGGGGIANVGPPDKSVDVHEFGHAFVGLLDEYQNNPSRPTFPIRAPNATSDEHDVPWQHFLDKKIKGVGVFEGGATFTKGVWRPALGGCAMNSAGNTGGYCPVCREAAMLRIYTYVNPIDKVSQDPYQEMQATAGDASEIVVTPMQPAKHDLKCEWFVDSVMLSEPGPKRPTDQATSDGLAASNRSGGIGGGRDVGREPAIYEYQPGRPSELGRIEKSKPPDPKADKPDRIETKGDKTKIEPIKFVFPTGKLPPGRYMVTCRVWDPCEWVLKDTQHLLEERETFWVKVSAKK